MRKWIFGQILVSIPSLVTAIPSILIAANAFQKTIHALSITWSELDIGLEQLLPFQEQSPLKLKLKLCP